jgi:hypothetical protein
MLNYFLYTQQQHTRVYHIYIKVSSRLCGASSLIMAGRVQWRRFAFFDKEAVNDNIVSALVLSSLIIEDECIRLFVCHRAVSPHVLVRKEEFCYLAMVMAIS